MSDLLAAGTPTGAPVSARVQNESSRPTAGASGARTMLTPTQVMAKRRDREARKQQEAAQKRQQELQESQLYAEPVVGVGDGTSGGVMAAGEPQPTATVSSVTASRRRQENVPTTNGVAARTGQSTTNQGQARPNVSQQAAVDPNYSGYVNKNRTEAFEKLSMPAVAGTRPSQPQNANYPQPATSAQTTSGTAFPHAFERWETLSSQWEGLTSYWIHRLQGNTEELSGKPIDQQMARQIADLSAAGANLFHAVVELQRLRASSERKFQRWFFETRTEQEHSIERIAELEKQLQHERENPSTTVVESTASVLALQAEKQKAEKLVGEMRRELQISKEEARRAWEELGRREQEERDRTIALRSGEPTSIGGVQVVPMAGPGLSSRQYASSNRPQTRDGPIPGGPGPANLGGQSSQEVYSRSQTTLESPDQEQAQFTYHPGGTSPTETDPFTETAGSSQQIQQLRHEPDAQFYSQQSQMQPLTSAAAIASQNVTSSAQSARSQLYGQLASTSAIYHPIPAVSSSQTPPRTGTANTNRSDPRSYIPSVSGAGSEEEYHINPDGSYTRDAQGRRIPYHQPISGPGEAEDDDDDDDGDYSAEIENERLYAQQYHQRQQQAAARITPQTSAPASSREHYVSPPQPQSTFQGQLSPVSPQSYTSTASATSPPQTSEAYEAGDGRQEPTSMPGWENIPTTTRHRHPTRLSDILEEQSSRTSPSRTSYISGEYPPLSTNNGHQRR